MNVLNEILFHLAFGEGALNKFLVLTVILTTVPMFLTVYQLTFAIYSIKVRMMVLNDLLMHYFPLEKFYLDILEYQEKGLNGIQKKMILNDIIKLHDQLCDGILLINSTFTFQMIPVLALILSNGVFALHSTIKEFVSMGKIFWVVSMNNTLWIIYYILALAFMANTGSKTSDEANRTSVIVLKIINNLEGNELLKNFEIFSQQITKREKVIRNVFFVIDWTVLFTMSATICTFLIITCQSDSTLSK